MCWKKSEVAQSCPTLCDPMDCSPPGSSIHGIFQARILEWVAISFSRRSSWPRDWTWVSHIVGRRFTIWATREVRMLKYQNTKAPIHQASVDFLSFPSRLSRGLFTQAKLASSLSLGLGHSSWPWALAFFCSPNWNSLYSSLHNQSQLKGQAQMVPPLRICLRLPWWLRR